MYRYILGSQAGECAHGQPPCHALYRDLQEINIVCGVQESGCWSRALLHGVETLGESDSERQSFSFSFSQNITRRSCRYTSSKSQSEVQGPGNETSHFPLASVSISFAQSPRGTPSARARNARANDIITSDNRSKSRVPRARTDSESSSFS